jgi:hypothetical protein
MRVRGGYNIGPRHMYSRVNGKGSLVNRTISFNHLAVFVYQNQVRNPYVRKVHPERVHPKVVSPLGITRCNVPRYTFAEAKFAKDPER